MFLRVRLQERQFLLLSGIRINVPEITETLLFPIVQGMRIIPLTQNTVSGTIGEADALPEERPSGAVAAGAIAAKILESLGISFCTYTKSVGPVSIKKFCPEEIADNAFYMPDTQAAQEASAYLEQCMKAHDSAGGVIECRINGVPAGLGTPVFEKLDAVLAQAVMSIGAVKAVEIGDGFQVSMMNGSSDNDGFRAENGRIVKTSNHAGGIMGGISDGSEIIVRATVKPTASISQPQNTVTNTGEKHFPGNPRKT